MSHIDCRSLTLDIDRLALVVRASHRHRPPLALLVTPEQFAALDAPDGYLGDVPLTTDADVIPPPKPVPEPEPAPPRPIAELRRERTAELQATIRDHVDQHLPPSEREALAALMQRCTLMRGMGIPVDDGALLALLAALGWAEDAMVLGAACADACAACETMEALQAVVVDLSSLGQPPVVSAGELARAIRGGA